MKTNEDIFKLIIICFIVAGIGFAFGLTYLQTVCAGYKECSPTYVASPSATMTVASPSATLAPTTELTAVLTPTVIETTPTNTVVTITTATSEVTIMKEIYTQELPRVPETGKGGK